MAQIIDSGHTGDCAWALDSNGVLTISGNGKTQSAAKTPAPWRAHCEKIYSVVMETGVTSIGDGAFYGCKQMRSVRIPDGATSIGKAAFCDCGNLRTVSLPHGVTSIGDGAFQRCFSLRKIDIPHSVTHIGKFAFEGCLSLQRVELPYGVTSIETCAFRECDLRRIRISGRVTSIGDGAFCNCQELTQVEDAYGVASIGKQAFADCVKLQSVSILEAIDIPYSPHLCVYVITPRLKTIGDYAFYGCENLKSSFIPEMVTFIGKSAFAHCSLGSAIVPARAEIDPIAFDEHTMLTRY